MMSRARKHHHTPQVLLGGFTDTGKIDGQLEVIDLVRRRTFKNAPHDVGAERDYNLVEVDGVDPLSIETDLLAQKIESPAANAFAAVRSGQMPNERQRADILAFIAMQALRAPSRRDGLNQFSTDVATQVVDLLLDDEELFDNYQQRHPETLGKLTRDDVAALREQIRIEHTPTHHLRTLLPSFATILALLERRAWVIYKAQGTDFVCCDDPVVLLPSGSRPPDEPRGFGNADAQVFMPVGSEFGLLGVLLPNAATIPTAWMSAAATPRESAALNGGLILGATRFVVSRKAAFSWLRRDEIAGRNDLVALVTSARIEQ